MAIRAVTKQLVPAAFTLTNMLTFAPSLGHPAGAITMVTVANTSQYLTQFRVSMAPNGAADATAHYLYYDVELRGNDTFIAEFVTGLPLQPGDVLRVYSENGACAFHVHWTYEEAS